MEKAYLFGTCLVDMFYPEVGLDTVALLKLCGYETVFPPAQTCCGQPPYNSGFSKEAFSIAKQTVTLFSESTYPLIVPSASCAGMIKHHYPRLLKEDEQVHEKAKSLADRTFELIDFIADKLPYESLSDSEEIHIALHESCTAQREMGVSDKWRAILSRMPNIHTNIPERHTECCGFGGTFAVKSDKLSSVMTEDKTQALLADHPQCITSGDCGCLMNIQGHLTHLGNKTECKPLARVVAERFGIHHGH